MARWSAGDKRVISQAKETLSDELKGKLSAYCTHVKGHGGVKKSLRLLTRVIPEFRYAARFDVARYYESIDHAVLLSQLKEMQVSQHNQDIVQQYLALPDRRNSGKGMIAGGSLSPLLGAVMLTLSSHTDTQLGRRGSLLVFGPQPPCVSLSSRPSMCGCGPYPPNPPYPGLSSSPPPWLAQRLTSSQCQPLMSVVFPPPSPRRTAPLS
jgi:hypothetical protein